MYHEFHLCILNETSSLKQKRSWINGDDNDRGDDVVDDDYDDELNYSRRYKKTELFFNTGLFSFSH